jgi:uncharacterized protein YkwD
MSGRVKPPHAILLVLLLLVVAGGALRTKVDAALVRDADGCVASGDMPSPENVETTRIAILCLLNAERAKHGLSPLRQEPLLELASQRHSEDMSARAFFEHETPDGIDPQQRIAATGYNRSWTGENLYAGTDADATPVRALRSWMHSPGHRANILRPQFTEVGVGVTYDFPERGITAPAGVYTTDFGG